MLFSKACDVTGIVACACARHGCFAPNSIVDLFRGEQQKNVDWSLLETIRSTNVHPNQGLTLHYDVACQYWVYLNDRIGHLLPSELEIDRAIGLFHVHAHKEECFYRFASSFIPGSGIVAGEILESLWSRLNQIATATRTATLAHRAEVIDDHASDSNHKKSLGMGQSDIFGSQLYTDSLVALVLCDRFGQAKDMVHTTSEYYTQFTSTISAGALKKWTKEIESAESRRLEDPHAMDIMGAQQLEITADLAQSGFNSNRPTGAGSEWLNLALSIEEKQYVFVITHLPIPLTFFNRIDVRDRVKRLQKEPREEFRLEVERLRRTLTTDLIHLQSLRSILNQIGFTETDVVDEPHEDSFNDSDDDVGEADSSGQDQVVDGDPDLGLPPERIPIHLPSSHNTTTTRHPLRQAELNLRIKQATRYLAALRDAIAQKSFQYSHVMRDAPSKGTRTRSRMAILRISDQIAQYSRLYCRARAAMVRLGADEPTLNKFRLLTRDDVKASTAILKPNIPGSSSLRLSWIWETGPRTPGSAPDAMRECKPLCPEISSCIDIQCLKFSVFIGFGPERKRTDGKRNFCL
jgi:hypothetical protein